MRAVVGEVPTEKVTTFRMSCDLALFKKAMHPSHDSFLDVSRVGDARHHNVK
jgi:hypothetical protein